MPIRSVDTNTNALDVARAATVVANNSKSQRPPAGGPEQSQQPAVVKSAAPDGAPPEPPPKEAAQMRFHVDQDTGKTVVALVDPNGQVLRQVPTQEALEVAKEIGKFQGMFVNLKV
ncbi:MAG TPA: flagellar protein FlaG [Polyangiales bacterium]|jgi:flagellar protein FlaG